MAVCTKDKKKTVDKRKRQKKKRLRKNLLVGRFELPPPELGRQCFSPLD